MYRPDVVGLKQFYAGTLGRAASTAIWRRIRALWPSLANDAVLALGYAVPYFSADCTERELVVAGMPAMQGALYWPHGAENRVAMVDEARLPFPDGVFNRVLVMHSLEHSDDLRGMMEEIWRVLVPGGRMLAVVPNRSGLWARISASPFGYGRPFSAGQMRDAAAIGGLTLTRVDSALYVPPSNVRWVLRAAPVLEVLGRMLAPHWGGVLLVEAEKQIYAALQEPVRARAGGAMISPIPVVQTAFSPVTPHVLRGLPRPGRDAAAGTA